MDKYGIWLKAALIRAIRTFGEAALAYIGTGALVLGDVNWMAVLSAGAFGFVSAMLLALTGLPEVDEKLPEQMVTYEDEYPPDQDEE